VVSITLVHHEQTVRGRVAPPWPQVSRRWSSPMTRNFGQDDEELASEAGPGHSFPDRSEQGPVKVIPVFTG